MGRLPMSTERGNKESELELSADDRTQESSESEVSREAKLERREGEGEPPIDQGPILPYERGRRHNLGDILGRDQFGDPPSSGPRNWALWTSPLKLDQNVTTKSPELEVHDWTIRGNGRT